jgi:hypothetical protein
MRRIVQGLVNVRPIASRVDWLMLMYSNIRLLNEGSIINSKA